MKILVVGLGSMGKRRVRNLQHLGFRDIIGFDFRADRREEAAEKFGIATFATFDDAMAKDPDALVISTPPDLHMQYAHIAARQNKHFFTEASVTDDGYDELLSLLKGKTITAAPSATMRFHPGVKILKSLVDDGAIGQVLAMTHHCGQYLPDWHPWEDYRTFYVAKKLTGACREIVPYELIWLTYLLGDVSRVSAMRAKLTRLETDIDDVYQLLMQFSSGTLGHLLIDVVARQHVRSLRLMAEESLVEWVAKTREVRLFDGKSQTWKTYAEPEPITIPGYVAVAENAYIDEMKAFTDGCTGIRPYPFSFADDHRILKTLYAAEQSSDSGARVAI